MKTKVRRYLKDNLSLFDINQRTFAAILGINEKTVTSWSRKNLIPRYAQIIFLLAFQLQSLGKEPFTVLIHKLATKNSKTNKESN